MKRTQGLCGHIHTNKSLYFVTPRLEVVTLFTETRERSVVPCQSTRNVSTPPPGKRKNSWPRSCPTESSRTDWTLRSNDATVTRTSKKRNMRVCKQKNNFARASRVFVHFFAVSARLRRENGYFRVLWRTQTSNDESLFLFLNLDVVPRNSTSGGFAYI